MSKFWNAFDKMFVNMGEMFEHLDEIMETKKEEKYVTKTIVKKIRGTDGEVHIDINGSSSAIDKITDQIIEIIDKYNKEIKESKNDNIKNSFSS